MTGRDRSVLRASVSFLFVTIVGATLSAEPIPAIDLRNLVTEADLIVVGTVVEMTDLGATSLGGEPDSNGRLVAGRILVRQVLKGTADGESVAYFSSIWWGAVQIGEFGANLDAVFLLKHRGDNIEFASSYYPSLRTVTGLRIKASNPLDAVIEAMAAVFRSTVASAAMKRRTIDYLGQLPLPEAVPGLRVALQDSESHYSTRSVDGAAFSQRFGGTAFS